MKDGLYRVVTSFFVAGFVVRNGQLAECAPILRKKLEGFHLSRKPHYYLTIAQFLSP